MKKLSLSVIVLFVVLITTSFMTTEKYDFIGTYGVPESAASDIQLKLIEDHTFIYTDFSNLEKKIDLKGTWELNGKTVVLKSNDSKFTFHNKWKFLNDGQVAKSRKGMTFYRLCKLS